MSGASSNVDRVEAWLNQLSDTFDFTLDGESKSLGEDLLDLAALGILDRSVGQEQQADGSSFAPNRGKYGDKKRSLGIQVGIGFGDPNSDKMMSLLNVAGKRELQPEEATATFGATDFAADKGKWFTNGSSGADGDRSGAKNQPPRPFYELDEYVAQDALDYMTRRVEAIVAMMNG